MTSGIRQLFQQDGMEARLTWYGPGMHMAEHAHDHHQVSWLLCGALLESSGHHAREILRPSVGIKPAGFEHSNTYGRHGALILSVNMRCSVDTGRFGLGFEDWCWGPRDTALPSATALARLAASEPDQAEDCLADLLALSEPENTVASPASPAWLPSVVDRLSDTSDNADMETVAREAGVHRVHLSRTFTRCLGLPPSLYRQRCRLARAIGDLVQGLSPAIAAQQAGFADQAHLTRTARQATGLTPRRLGQLLQAA